MQGAPDSTQFAITRSVNGTPTNGDCDVICVGVH
jgi:hypothetical protein